MDQRTLHFLTAAAYIIATIALCRVLGASLARKRFSIRHLLYVTTVVAATTALVVSAGWL